MNKEKGQSLVEMALVAPILIFLMIGTFEVGWALRGYLILANANREAARFSVRQDYLDFDAPDIDYQRVVSHTLTSLSNQLDINFIDKGAMIISYISVDATCTGTFTITTPIDLPTHTVTIPATSAHVTRLDYQQLGADMLVWQTEHVCQENAYHLPSRKFGIVAIEMFYEQPQLLGFPLISNPFTDPVPMYAHTSFRKVQDLRMRPTSQP